ncbi:MAG: GNAT family N-acetyltransferase [Caldilineaceae bacterium]
MITSVRRGTIDDLAVMAELLVDVQRLHAEALPHFFKPPQAGGFSEDVVRGFVDDPNNVVFLAEEQDGDAPPVVVGYLCAVLKNSAENPFAYARTTCHIEHLSVRPDRQGAGHGNRLMQAVRTYAQEQGATILSLSVWDFNKKAQRFFQAQGYVPASHRMVIWGERE